MTKGVTHLVELAPNHEDVFGGYHKHDERDHQYHEDRQKTEEWYCEVEQTANKIIQC